MLRLCGAPRPYPWGSATRIPELCGQAPTGEPVAEMWFGAHGTAPSTLSGNETLAAYISSDPKRILGADVTARFGPDLPYLLKLIAPERPLSLQVHPNTAQARAGHAREAARGGRDQPDYPDANHKPELVYALSTFEAVSGFRAPRRAAELFTGVAVPLARRVLETLRGRDPGEAMRAAFALVLQEASPADVEAIAAACARRLEDGSTPSQRSDHIAGLLAREHPGDAGVVAALLMNPVTLRPGEAMFIPAGCVHAYLSGFGVELMASSDNVLRAGLTSKHIDVAELLSIVDYTAAPPIRLAAESFGPQVSVFYAPVDDFELSVVQVEAEPVQIRGKGPRIVLGLEGEVRLQTGGELVGLAPGHAVFVDADEPAVTASGRGRLVQADVP